MSFLLSRANNNSSSNHPLFDADDEDEVEFRGQARHGAGAARRKQVENDHDDDDDELEAAFGDSHRGSASTSSSRQQQQQQRHGHVGADDSLHEEGDEAQGLLGNTSQHVSSSAEQRPGQYDNAVASGSGRSPRPGYSRNNSTATTVGNQSTVSAGGYDFEADPYDRRSAAASTSDLQATRPARPHGQRRSRRNGGSNSNSSNNAGTGFFSTLRNHIPLPSRLRQYGLLSNTGNRSNGRRRADGNADADDDDDDSDDDAHHSDWIMPPQSMPGLFGGGTKNDGVFSNMTAKPGQNRSARPGDDIVGGDDEAPEKEIPPAYEMAVLDAAPPYFDTTVHTSGVGALGGVSGGLEEILIEGLPLGNIFSFFWSLLVSMSFQFVGFLLTTLLSTSHAAKNGSRAGLGVTLIQYGLYLGQEIEANNALSGGSENAAQAKDDWAAFWGDGQVTPDTSTMSATVSAAMAVPTSSLSLGNSSDLWDGPMLLDGGAAVSGVTSSWPSMLLMIGGWFLLMSSVIAYLKAIRYAKAMRDGVSSDPDSFLENGGLPALLSRLTGREIMPPRERTWGLPSRPAPREPPAPAVPPLGSRPAIQPPSSTTTVRTPGTAGI